MPRVDTPYPGSGIDIAVHDGQLVVATVDGSRVRLQRGGSIVHTPTAPAGLLARTLRIAVADDGTIACIAQIINPDRACLYLRGSWQVLPYSLWGQDPMGVTAIGTRFVWGVVTMGGGTLIVEHEDGEKRELPCNTSQGILYWDGMDPVLADDAKDVRVDGRSIFRGTERGAWVAGYGDDCAVLATPGYWYTLAQGNPSTPRLAVSGDTVYVAYSLDGPKLITLTPPYPTEAVTIPAIGRPLWLGWFDFAEPTRIGNCFLPVGVGKDGILRTHDGRAIAVYVQGEPDGDVASLERRAADAKRATGLPVIGYWTRQAQAGRVPAVDHPGVEAYRLAGESIAAFTTRVTAALARCAAPYLIAQSYSSNASLHADLAALVPLYATIARDVPKMRGLLAFSGSGRSTGLQDHPEIRPLWVSLAQGIPKAPDLEPAMTLKPPAATVRRFDGLIRPGWRMEIEDTGNPELGVTVSLEVRSNGSLHATLANKAGKNTTGVERKVI